MVAAAAVGAGLDRDQALRAITLTPAEILGIAQDTGSLQPGKLADVLVTDRPLFASDSRVLLVLARGRNEFEVK
jgi:imidazolonepropionase-like amidohydrolase